MQGVYASCPGALNYPKVDPQLGLLQPATDDIVKTLTGLDAPRLKPIRAYAKNPFSFPPEWGVGILRIGVLSWSGFS